MTKWVQLPLQIQLHPARLSGIVSKRTINLRSAQVVAMTLVEMIQAMVADGIWKARVNTNR